jgi:hypothetical protein
MHVSQLLDFYWLHKYVPLQAQMFEMTQRLQTGNNSMRTTAFRAEMQLHAARFSKKLECLSNCLASCACCTRSFADHAWR